MTRAGLQDIPCPAGCRQRFLTDGGAGKHLERAHERGRWSA